MGVSAKGDRSWAEIDLTALRANAQIAGGEGKLPLMAIIKANAYGHGAVEVARALSGGVALFGVASVAEALELRDAGLAEPIFLLGSSLPCEIPIAVENGFIFSIPDEDSVLAIAEEATRQEKQAEGHLIFDTGMGRIGFIDPSLELLQRIAGQKNLKITGLASHFPAADEDEPFTRDQLGLFASLVTRSKAAGLEPVHLHIANSAGILALGKEEGIGGLLRPGLMLYGVDPRTTVQDAGNPELQRVLQLKARVSAVRDLPKGWGISYGRSFVTAAPMRVATVSIGYGDGYPRHLSGQNAEVLIRGQRCPVLGRVTMDQVMVDVGHLSEVLAGDEVVLFGDQEGASIEVTEVADWAGTIAWEVFTGITPRVQRIYKESV